MSGLLGNMVKVLEQYTTKLSSEEHQALQQAIKWLNDNGFLKKTNKYEVTRYALKTLVDIVESKKKKAEFVKQNAKQDVKQDSKQDVKKDTKQNIKPDDKQDSAQKVV